MKTTLPFILFFLSISFSSLYGQNMSIMGQVTDTIGESLPVASVLLLDVDSVYLDFTQTDEEGRFRFDQVEQKDYLLKFTYLSYLPLVVPISGDQTEVDLGVVQMKPIATELMEVVIREAKAPMRFKGDTIEYDPSQFQVPEGSSVEDLLKKLPGMRVDRDGTITAQGQEVKKVTVDGKEFFGGDPKEVTKNLPAEGVSKVQVFDHKTEEEKITGEDNNPDDKELNIELKEDYKSGTFGRAVAGYGTEDRYEFKGNVNRFNEKNQLGLVLLANNTNRNGLDWDDYQEFMGSSSGDRFGSNLEYGFRDGGGFFIFFGDRGDNDLDTRISSMFFGGSNVGYFENILGGLNYNFQDDKVKLGLSYFYNDKYNTRKTLSNSQSYFQDFSTSSNGENTNNSDVKGHRVESSVRYEIDSFNTVEAMANFSLVNNDRAYQSLSNSYRNSSLINKSTQDNLANFGGNLINGSLVYRRTFRKKGRLFAINGTLGDTNTEEDKLNRSDQKFYQSGNENNFTADTIRQNTAIEAKKSSYAFNTQYNEPLNKNFSVSVFYNHDHFDQTGDQKVLDSKTEQEIVNQDLSRNYENRVTSQRAGSSVRYNKDGINISAGAAYKQLDLVGEVMTLAGGTTNGDIDKKFQTWIPYLSLRYPLSKTGSINFTFTRSYEAPSIRQLIPVVDNLNPLDIYEGNPFLDPGDSYNYRINGYYSIPLKGLSFWYGLNYSDIVTAIVNEELVDENLVTYRKPINYDGGSNFSIYTGFDIQIYKKYVKGGIYGNYSLRNNYTLVNKVENETETRSIYFEPRVQISPTEKINVDIEFRHNSNRSEFSINTSQNQKYNNNRITVDADLQLYKELYFNGRYQHNFYNSERYQNYDIPILDASLYYQFLKNNQGQLRLSAYDIFNKNENVSNWANENGSGQSFTETLAQYFLLSFRYNIRGWQSGVNK